jgi:gliding motility-associated-like protein
MPQIFGQLLLFYRQPMTRPLTVLFLFLCLALQGFGQQGIDFASSVSGGCSPLVVQFSPTTPGFGAGANFSWDLGNGNVATVATPQAIYTVVGNYTITLTVTEGGRSASVAHTLTVYAPPTADFTASATVVCGEPVVFSNTSTASGGASIVGLLWDFEDGSTQQGGLQVSHLFPQGSGSVNLTVTDSHGCTASTERQGIVTTLAPLRVGFTPDKLFLCTLADVVQFTNTTSGPPTLSYTWDFGDGTTSTALAPTHGYAQTGTYTVKLTATSTAGCSVTSTRTDLLNVANYGVDLQAPGAICANEPVNIFDNSSPAPTSRVWTVNGVSQGNGPTLNYAFSNGGIYSIGLTDHFGNCPLVEAKSMIVNTPPPYTPFSVTQPPCGPPGTVTFTDHTPGAVSWSWNLGGGSPSVATGQTVSASFGNAGTFSETLTVTNAAGCSTTVSTPVYLYAPALVVTELDHNGWASCNTPITKTYSVLTAGVVSYDWDFSDGSPHSSAASPTHVFTQPGTYITALHYTLASGCSGTTYLQQVTISAPFSVDFSASPTTVCTNADVYFTNNLASVGAVGYSFDFGDGGVSTSTVEHNYGLPGTYTVKLSAWNVGGCIASTTKTAYITVVGPSATYGGHTLSCANTGGDVSFSYPGTGITSFTWDFGDGTTVTTDGTVNTQQHTYTASRIYYPNVTATAGQCTVQFRDVVPVMIHSPATVIAASTTVCSNGTLPVQIAAQRNDWPGLADPDFDYAYQFQYADGSPYLGAMWHTNLGGLYGNGVYNWTLSGFDPTKTGLKVVMTAAQFGCVQTTNTIPLTILSAGAVPAVTVLSDDACYNTPVVLQDASVAGAGNSIVAGTWDFGDGQTQALVAGGRVTHLYANPGEYSVKLSIQDASGCTVGGTAALAVVDVDGPKAAFSSNPATVLLGNTVFFTNSSNEFGSAGTSYSWDFGDASASAAVDPTHLYAGPGVYSVTLTARNAAGTCSSVAAATVVVKNFNSHFQMAASYVSKASCPPVLVQFTNTSANYTSVAWDFGDGVTAGNINTPSHVYPHPGAYQVTLYIYGAGGLTGQYTDSVFVRQPSGGLAVKTPAVCVNQPAQLQASGKGVLRFSFDYGDGTVSAGGLDSLTSHVYTVAGDYVTQLVVTDTLGCSVAADASVGVRVNPLPTIVISPADAHVCLGSGTQLRASGGSSYVWSPAASLDDASSAAPVASPVVNTVYTVLGTDDNGCQGQGSVDLKVVMPQTLHVFPDSTGVCMGDTVGLHAKGTDVYQWIGDVAGLSSTGVANPVVQPMQTTHYTVVGSDAFSCFSDTLPITVTVMPLPTVNGGGGVEVVAGTPVVLAAAGSADIVQWQWAPPDYLSCSDCAQPVSTPKKPETYVVTVTNGVGCHARDTVQVKLLCAESRVRIPEGFSPNGDGHNDRFVILGIGFVDHLVIYDRWGIKVFERDHFYAADLDGQWDGSFHGQPVPTGVYVYFVQISCPAGGPFTRKGTVVLVR